MCFSVVRGSGGQHPRNLSVATGVVGCGCQEVGDRGLLLHAALLAVDGADLALHDVAVLEDALPVFVLSGPSDGVGTRLSLSKCALVPLTP